MNHNTIKVEGVEYVAEHSLDAYSCEGCDLLHPTYKTCRGVKCGVPERDDNTDVIFKQVRNETK